MNEDAGRGGALVVTLRLEDGEELPFVVDTGSPLTHFDKSLEPKLGKRLHTGTFWNFGTGHEAGFYAAPRLYLGSTRLVTGSRSIAVDFKQLSSAASFADHHILGILGMDCLRHYCIQLDFEAGQMRFLNPHHLDTAKLGKAFPLTFSSEDQNKPEFICPFIHQGGLIGETGTNLLIDTGDNLDGYLETLLFWREVREEVLVVTNQAAEDQGSRHHVAFFPQCVWSGQTYTNLIIQERPDPGPNLIGLRFLARHLVTFDFPKRIMYLKPTSTGPLAGDTFLKMLADATTEPAKTLERLKSAGQLPGWPKDEAGQLHCFYHLQGDSNSETFNFRKNDDSSVYHYQVTRASEDQSVEVGRSVADRRKQPVG